MAQQPHPTLIDATDSTPLTFWQKRRLEPAKTTAVIMATANIAAAGVTIPSLLKDRQTAEATKNFLLSDSIFGKGIPNVVVLAVAAVLVEAVAAALVYSSLSPRNVEDPLLGQQQPSTDTNPIPTGGVN